MKKLLALLLLLAMITACFIGCEIASESESGEGNDSDSIAYVGESVSYNDLAFTLVKVEKYVDNSEWVLDEPAEGKEFVVLKIKVQNNGSENEHINMFYEDSYCDDVAVDPVAVLFSYDGDTIWGDVASGRTREGYVAYELPIGWEKLEFVYSESLSNEEITLIALSKNVSEEPVTPNTEDKDTSNEETANSTEAETNVQENTTPKTAGVGETLTSGGLEFTFVAIENYIDDSEWALDEPAEGKEFVILKFSVKNVGSENDYINMYYEDSYCDNTSTDPVMVLFNYDGDTIWGDVAPGKFREGYVAYELPVGWQKIEFMYNPSLTGTDTNQIVFVGYSSDIE